METYADLKNEGYVQYLVLLSKGTYEGGSVAVIYFYYLTKEEKTATEVANEFKIALNEYNLACNEYNLACNKNKHESERTLDVSQRFLRLLSQEWHETGPEYDCFLVKGFDNNPHFGIPLVKIINLQGIDDSCSEDGEGLEIVSDFNVNNPQ